MTEQQFKKLKQHLDASAKQSPSALDDAILSKAREAASVKVKSDVGLSNHRGQNDESDESDESDKSDLANEPSVNNAPWFSAFFQTTFAQSAFVSVALTIALFATLALLVKPSIKPEQESLTATPNSKEIGFELVQQSPNDNPKILQNHQWQTEGLSRTDMPHIDMPETQQGRDQILAQMPLPDVQALLDEMDFSAQPERQLTKDIISLAIKDIRIMIDNQNLNGARVRYARLRDSCYSCPLPDSLEALLIATSQNST